MTVIAADADADEGTPEIVRICSSARSSRQSLINKCVDDDGGGDDDDDEEEEEEEKPREEKEEKIIIKITRTATSCKYHRTSHQSLPPTCAGV